MSTVLSFTTKDGEPFLIEVGDASGGSVRRGLRPSDVSGEAVDTFDSLVERIHAPIRAVLDAFKNATDDIDEVELGFALTVRADAGIVVSKIGADANFHVTVKWNRSALSPPAPFPRPS